MISDIISGLLYGILFSLAAAEFLPDPLGWKNRAILLFSSWIYLVLTRLSGPAAIPVLFLYGLLFVFFRTRLRGISLCCAQAGFFLALVVGRCCFSFLSFFRPVSLFTPLPAAAILLITAPLLKAAGYRLGALFPGKTPDIPGVLAAEVFLFFLSLEAMLLYPSVLAVSAASMAVLAVLSFLLLFRLARLVIQEQKNASDSRSLRTLEAYTENLEQANLQLRRFKHDYTNILSTMSDYMEQGNLLGLKSYFQDQILPMSSQMQLSSFDASALSSMQIPEVKSLLISKILSERAKSLKVKIQIASPISWMVMDTGDFCRVLGIYLDNALDGALESEKKELQISLDDTAEGHSLVIINSCDSPSLPLDRIGQESFTTKGSGHGMGLATAAEILKKHPYVYKRTLLKDGYFIQQLDNF